MKTFLIGHMGALGDFVLSLPALKYLRSSYPDHEFVAIGHPEHLKIATQLRLLDRVYDRESRWLIPLFSGEKIPAPLPEPDGAVFWMSAGDSLERLIRRKAGLPVLFLPTVPPAPIPAADYYVSRIRNYFSLPDAPPLDKLFSFGESAGQKILIHPGSGNPSKNHSLKFYLQLKEYLSTRTKREIGFLLGPVEMEAGLQNELPESAVYLSPTVQDLMAFLQETELYIGNDSGVSQLVGLMNRPCIVFYRTTSPVIWGIRSEKSRIINTEAESEAFQQFKDILNSNVFRKILI